jgi:hypothetical protein
MKLFDRKGMMIIPNPITEDISSAKKLFVAEKLFCSNGHNLISSRASFNNRPGILVKAKKGRKTGYIALSPIYGEKVRVALDIDLESGELIKLLCPDCSAEIPAYAECTCGGSLLAFFLAENADFSDCIGICNRVDCSNANLIKSGSLISISMIDSM